MGPVHVRAGVNSQTGTTVACMLMVSYAAVLDDGLLDVSYVMNYPREQVPTLLRELMRGREESDTLEIMDCFGSMRVNWLEVHCADGLQASLFPSNARFCKSFLGFLFFASA